MKTLPLLILACLLLCGGCAPSLDSINRAGVTSSDRIGQRTVEIDNEVKLTRGNTNPTGAAHLDSINQATQWIRTELLVVNAALTAGAKAIAENVTLKADYWSVRQHAQAFRIKLILILAIIGFVLCELLDKLPPPWGTVFTIGKHVCSGGLTLIAAIVNKIASVAEMLRKHLAAAFAKIHQTHAVVTTAPTLMGNQSSGKTGALVYPAPPAPT